MIENKKTNVKAFSSVIAIIALIVAIITLVVTAIGVAYAVASYNERYVSSAKTASTMVYPFTSYKTSLDGEATPNRGKFYYGFYQSEGKLNTKYTIEYKRANAYRFKYFDNYTVTKNLTANDKNKKKYWGKISFSKKYFFRVLKVNNLNITSVFNFDWFIE